MLPTIHRVRFPKRQQPVQQPVGLDITRVVQMINEVDKLKRTLESTIPNMEKRTADESDRIIAKYNRFFADAKEQFGKHLSSMSAQNREVYAELRQKVDSVKMLKGDAGYTPIKGKDYFDGKPGKKGKDADEKTITTNVITSVTAQINGLKSTLFDELKKKILEIVTKEFEQMRGEIRHLSSKIMLGGAGGGMGSIVPFTLAGDGNTTQFTLPAIPTQEGLGLIVHYQGQFLQTTTHYTVSGKTISLTFTPEASTFIEGFVIT